MKWGSRDHTIGEVKKWVREEEKEGRRERERAREERGMGEGGRERGRDFKITFNII